MWGDLLRCLQLRTPRAALLPEKELNGNLARHEEQLRAAAEAGKSVMPVARPRALLD